MGVRRCRDVDRFDIRTRQKCRRVGLRRSTFADGLRELSGGFDVDVGDGRNPDEVFRQTGQNDAGDFSRADDSEIQLLFHNQLTTTQEQKRCQTFLLPRASYLVTFECSDDFAYPLAIPFVLRVGCYNAPRFMSLACVIRAIPLHMSELRIFLEDGLVEIV